MSLRVAIVGHEAAKFTSDTEARARQIIRLILGRPGTIVVSGGCHLGGVDIFAAEEGRALGLEVREYLPEELRWKPPSGAIGFWARNLQIAGDCDEAHSVVVAELPPTYKSPWRFPSCYHCDRDAKNGGGPPRRQHVKSGGCWTVLQARERGAGAFWHIVHPEYRLSNVARRNNRG